MRLVTHAGFSTSWWELADGVFVGVGRWGLRVEAYAFLLATDQYPPFSLK